MTYRQSTYDLRCEWGDHGTRLLALVSEVVIVVDVLSFSTCVDVAVSRGAQIIPCRKDDPSPAAFAEQRAALLAGSWRSGGYSLSPQSVLNIPAGTRLVLPSLNGSSLCMSTGSTPTLAGCLRNARAVARAAQSLGKQIAVIAAGECWQDDGSLRPAVEDWIGAGAILACLSGTRSPEAEAAIAAFEHARPDLPETLLHSVSGIELVERGYEQDVHLAAALNVSSCAPFLVNGAFMDFPDGCSLDG